MAVRSIDVLTSQYKEMLEMPSTSFEGPVENLLETFPASIDDVCGLIRISSFVRLATDIPIDCVRGYYSAVMRVHMADRLDAPSTIFACAYWERREDGSPGLASEEPSYVCMAPTYESRDGEYRHRFVRYSRFNQAFVDYADTISSVEKEMAELLEGGIITVSVAAGAGSQLEVESRILESVESQRLIVKTLSAIIVTDGMEILSGTVQSHTHDKYQRCFKQIMSMIDISALGNGDLTIMANYISTGSAENRFSGCGQKLTPMTALENLNPDDFMYTSIREAIIADSVSDLVFSFVTPCLPMYVGYSYLEGTGRWSFENSHSIHKFHRSDHTDEVVRRIREAPEVYRLMQEEERENELVFGAAESVIGVAESVIGVAETEIGAPSANITPSVETITDPLEKTMLESFYRRRIDGGGSVSDQLLKYIDVSATAEGDLFDEADIKAYTDEIGNCNRSESNRRDEDRAGRELDDIEIENFEVQLEEFVDNTAESMVLGENSMLHVVEHTGPTFRNWPLLLRNAPVDPQNDWFIFSDRSRIERFTFECCYTLAALFERLSVVHTDLHTNNITVFSWRTMNRGLTADIQGDGELSATWYPLFVDTVPYTAYDTRIPESALFTDTSSDQSKPQESDKKKTGGAPKEPDEAAESIITPRDIYLFETSPLNPVIIDFSRAVVGSKMRHRIEELEVSKRYPAGVYAEACMQQQASRIARSFARYSPTFGLDNFEKIKAIATVYVDSALQVLTLVDYAAVGRAIVSVSRSAYKLDMETVRRQAAGERVAFARRRIHVDLEVCTEEGRALEKAALDLLDKRLRHLVEIGGNAKLCGCAMCLDTNPGFAVINSLYGHRSAKEYSRRCSQTSDVSKTPKDKSPKAPKDKSLESEVPNDANQLGKDDVSASKYRRDVVNYPPPLPPSAVAVDLYRIYSKPEGTTDGTADGPLRYRSGDYSRWVPMADLDQLDRLKTKDGSDIYKVVATRAEEMRKRYRRGPYSRAAAVKLDACRGPIE